MTPGLVQVAILDRMSAATPTLPDFDDGTWEQVDGVNVFDAHKDHDAVSGEVIRSFDLEKLEKIVLACNRRDKLGQPCPLTIGHTIEGKVPEKYQPEIVGYARKFRVEYDARLERWVIKATYYVRKERLEEARSFPRVSVEYWPGDDIFDPISLIRRTPKRDLGQWTYAAGSQRVRYEREAFMADDVKKKKPDDSKGPDLDADAVQPGMDGGMDQGPPPDFMKNFQYCMDAMAKSGQLLQYMQGMPSNPMGPQPMAMPGATNQQIPAPATFAADADKQRMVKTDQAITGEQYARDIAELRAQYAAERDARLVLEKRERASRYERDLTGLRAQGWQFDLAEEMDLVKDYDDPTFIKHLGVIKKNYQRSSVGVDAPLVRTLGGETGIDQGQTDLPADELANREEFEVASQYQREKHLPESKWDECKQYAIKTVRNRSLVNGRK